MDAVDVIIFVTLEMPRHLHHKIIGSWVFFGSTDGPSTVADSSIRCRKNSIHVYGDGRVSKQVPIGIQAPWEGEAHVGCTAPGNVVQKGAKGRVRILGVDDGQYNKFWFPKSSELKFGYLA